MRLSPGHTGVPGANNGPPRRDSTSLDYTKGRQPGGLPPAAAAAAAAAAALGPYYGLGGAASLNGGPLGLVSSANHSLTPPPNLSGSAGATGLGLGGRLALPADHHILRSLVSLSSFLSL